MATKGIKFRKVWTSLTLRVLVLLTLTMAPIGTIALYQTSILSQALEDQAHSALIAATLESVTAERVALERAIGSAEALSLATVSGWADTEACTRAFAEAISGRDGYRFAGIVTRQGLTCATGSHRAEILAFANADEAFAGTAPIVVTDLAIDDPVTALVAHPVERDGSVLHYVLLELTSDPFNITVPTSGTAPEIAALLSASGKVVRKSSANGRLKDEMPSGGLVPTDEIDVGVVTEGTSAAGFQRVYSVTPLYRDALYVVATWRPESTTLAGAGSFFAAWIFPIFMWVATLIVTYFAINRLMMRHVRHLGLQMRRFARNRTVPAAEITGRQPIEFGEMTENFRAMARTIVEDEAVLEDALRQRTVLLREVHHRVKNNLQLIASIANMQIRKSDHPEATDVLRRLQDRVLGLAAVHRQMYRSEVLDQVPAKEVVRTILDQVVPRDSAVRVQFDTDDAPLTLAPEQAVPFSLLFAEAATNAATHLGASGPGKRSIDVSLHVEDDGNTELTIANTIDNVTADKPPEDGLGLQLMRAFAGQLNGEISTEAEDGRHIVRFRFRPEGFRPSGTSRTVVDSGHPPADNDSSEPRFPKESAASAST